MDDRSKRERKIMTKIKEITNLLKITNLQQIYGTANNTLTP